MRQTHALNARTPPSRPSAQGLPSLPSVQETRSPWQFRAGFLRLAWFKRSSCERSENKITWGFCSSCSDCEAAGPLGGGQGQPGEGSGGRQEGARDRRRWPRQSTRHGEDAEAEATRGRGQTQVRRPTEGRQTRKEAVMMMAAVPVSAPTWMLSIWSVNSKCAYASSFGLFPRFSSAPSAPPSFDRKRNLDISNLIYKTQVVTAPKEASVEQRKGNKSAMWWAGTDNSKSGVGDH